MPRKSSAPLWHATTIGERHFHLLNLDHPRIAAQIFRDMDAGIAVYYDRRWQVTTQLCTLLVHQPALVAARTVLILGAGVGLETVVIGSLCRTLYLNDLAPAALTLCAQQLRHNGINHFTCYPGRYETLPLPPVDLIVGCYLVYNRDTAAAMRQLLARPTPPILLANDNLINWQQLLDDTTRPRQQLLYDDENTCVLFAKQEDRAPEAAPRPRRR
jgi:predicted nicotinamide N-methyase